MNFGILGILSVLIVVGFIRSRPKGSKTTLVDQLFVGLAVLAALLPAVVAGPVMQRASTAPLIESVAFFLGTVVVGFPRLQSRKWCIVRV